MLELSLSKNLISVFLRLEDFEGKTFSYTVRKLSKDYSESTVKYVLRRLRDSGLIDCGNNSERGKPLKLTKFGRKIFGVIAQPGRVLGSKPRDAGSKHLLEKAAPKAFGKVVENPVDPTILKKEVMKNE